MRCRLLVVVCFAIPRLVAAQGLTGALFGTVKDAQGGVLPGALVRVSSPALLGGSRSAATDNKGQLRFPALAPGDYALDVELSGFSALHEADITIGAGWTIERNVVLNLSGMAESITVQGAGSHIEARDPGLSTRFGIDDIRTIPTRRSSMFDWIRAAPGISPTSPASSSATTVSAFGSGTNENQFLFDGTNFTCPCNGVARSEPGIDFIQEVQVHSIGSSVEFGNVEGAVINVITRQGGERFVSDASYYGQPSALTSQPVLRPLPKPMTGESGYERARYRDMTANVGGPLVHDRAWFFTGYQYLRDYDSQPGSDPAYPRMYEQNKVMAKVTWKLTRNTELMHNVHYERWVNPEQPTVTKPFEATLRIHATVPAMTFGQLTQTLSPNAFWDVRVGRFVHDRVNDPSTGDRTAISRFDRVTGVFSGAPPEFGGLTLIRTTAKTTFNRFQSGFLGADHQWKVGGSIERGEGHGPSVIPTGVRYVDNAGQKAESISAAPSLTGGQFITSGAFASDTFTAGDRLTVSAGIRYDHSRAISQDLHALDGNGNETDQIVHGLGTLYTWNLWSPRLGVTTKVTADGRTMVRASWGLYRQGVLTGEFSGLHPGVTPVTTAGFDAATNDYTRIIRVDDPSINRQLDSGMHAPRTEELSIGLDREVGRRLAVATAYVHKSGDDFIGWTDIGGEYREETRILPDGRSLPVLALTNSTSDQRFLLTNPSGYSMTYNGLVAIVEKRPSQGWQAFGSYTFSRASGLQASSGTNAAGAQSSSVALPTATFGLDPNDLTNARGRLANDRPHIFRVMGRTDLPRTHVALAANFQYFSGKPWAATAQVALPQGDQRILLEPRGTRRLPSQSLLDLRVSTAITMRGLGRVELLFDVLNALNDTAEESVATDNLFSPNFGRPTVFMDPRRAMIGVRLNVGP